MGVFNLKFKEADGSNRKEDFGALFDSPWEGNYGVSLTLRTGEDNEEGYPIRERVVAIKTEGGRTLDISEAFINFSAFEAMAARPPRED
jgi:hypothetical protein